MLTLRMLCCSACNRAGRPTVSLSWRESAVRSIRAAFAQPGALERTVRHTIGDMPGRQLLVQLVEPRVADPLGSGNQQPYAVAGLATDLGWFARRQIVRRPEPCSVPIVQHGHGRSLSGVRSDSGRPARRARPADVRERSSRIATNE